MTITTPAKTRRSPVRDTTVRPVRDGVPDPADNRAAIRDLWSGLPSLTGDARRDAAAFCSTVMIARPKWVLGANGPSAFDCWSMLAMGQRHLFDRRVDLGDRREGMSRGDILRAFAGTGQGFGEARAQWRARPAGAAPQHGDGVLMSHQSAPHHCGMYLDVDRGVVAHHAEHGGFSVDDLQFLRLGGYRDLVYYEWIGGHE